jgi:hypothetical protein
MGFPASSREAPAQRGITVIGANTNCAAWTSARRAPLAGQPMETMEYGLSMWAESWALGSLSGLAIQSGDDFLRNANFTQIWEWLDTACLANPNAAISDMLIKWRNSQRPSGPHAQKEAPPSPRASALSKRTGPSVFRRSVIQNRSFPGPIDVRKCPRLVKRSGAAAISQSLHPTREADRRSTICLRILRHSRHQTVHSR